MSEKQKLEYPPNSLFYNRSFESSPKSQGTDKKLDRLEKSSVAIIVSSVVLAALFPYPATKFFLAFVLGLFFVYLCFTRIDLALCFFIFFMPALDLFPPTFFGVKGLNAQTLIVLLLIMGSFSAANKSVKKGSSYDPLKLPVIFLISMVLLSIVNSSVFGRYSFMGLLAYAKNWLIYIVLYFIVLRNCDREHHQKLFFFILITIIIAVAFSLKDYIGGGIVLSARASHRNSGGVIAGHPNLFGGFLAMYLPFFISVLSLKIKGRFLFLGGLVICLIALITTLSRGAWLAFLVSMGFLGIVRNRKLLIILIFAMILAPLWLPSSVRERIDKTQHTATASYRYEDQQFDASTEVRLRQWKGLPKMMALNPIIGSGFGTFNNIVFKSGVLPFRKSAHATIVKVAVEGGMLGLIAYLWILMTVFKNAWYVSKRSEDPFDKAVATGLLGCVIALFVADLSGTRFYCNELTAYFWIITAIVVRARINLLPTKHSTKGLYKRRSLVQG